MYSYKQNFIKHKFISMNRLSNLDPSASLTWRFVVGALSLTLTRCLAASSVLPEALEPEEGDFAKDGAGLLHKKKHISQ